MGQEGMPERDALLVLIQLARAMERSDCTPVDPVSLTRVWHSCEAAGLTSNDFKLNNVLVNSSTAGVCLADFGLWSCSNHDYKVYIPHLISVHIIWHLTR